MTISAAAIIYFATPARKANVPGISEEVRNRLEWTWGLGHNHLDEHLHGFDDPHGVLLDENLLVFPHNDMIRDVAFRNANIKLRAPRPYIQKLYQGRTSFEYVVVPLDPSDPLPPRTLVSNVPPHLVLCTTSGKIQRAWGKLPSDDYTAFRLSLIERSKTATQGNSRPPLSIRYLDDMQHIHRTWSFVDFVPSSFLSEDSDQTMVEPDDDSRSESSGMASVLGPSASCYHEPQRRLFPHELQNDPVDVQIPLFPSADGDTEDDDDDTISSDSHITGVEDPEEYAKAKASVMRADDKADRRWKKAIQTWAEDTSGGADETLLNDGQIKEDPKEQPRMATSLDLSKPDYLSRRKRRTAP
ncbi:hypothetical protein C8R43DRAFT_1241118 [Mycena crocata]|nr:hypothetical protein C8R43DRAFT_1241118 [Mycena crocata]